MSKLTINNYDDLQLKCISIMKEIQTNVTSYFEFKKNLISNLSLRLNEKENEIEKENQNFSEFKMDKIYNKVHKRNKEIQKMKEEEKEEIVDKVLIQYKLMTGILVERIDNKTMKINFNFTNKENEYYIILFFENECFYVKKIFPEEIKLDKYLNNNKDIVQNLTLFLVKLINYEIIPLIN